MGVHAIKCDNAADLPAKMKEFMEYDNSKPILLEAVVVPDEHVYPVSVRRLATAMINADGNLLRWLQPAKLCMRPLYTQSFVSHVVSHERVLIALTLAFVICDLKQ